MSNSFKIKQYTLNGEFVRNWDSIQQAEAEFNRGYGTIKRCILGKVKSAYGYIWEYSDEPQECHDLTTTADMAAAELVECYLAGGKEEVEAFIANPCEATLEMCDLPVIAHLYISEMDGYTEERNYGQLAKTTKKLIDRRKKQQK